MNHLLSAHFCSFATKRPIKAASVKPILVGSEQSACPLAAFQLLAIASLRLVTTPCVRSSILAHRPPISDLTVHYCSSKNLYHYGVKLHVVTKSRPGGLPVPDRISADAASSSINRTIASMKPQRRIRSAQDDRCPGDGARDGYPEMGPTVGCPMTEQNPRHGRTSNRKGPARRADGHDRPGGSLCRTERPMGPPRQARILGRRRTFSSTTIGTALSARKFS